MLFNSLQFLLFFPVVVLLYYAIPDRFKYLWLLAASYYFYMCWNAKYALLMLFSTAVTYASGLLLNAENLSAHTPEQKARRKKVLAALSFILNLGVLFLFKYLGFTIEHANQVLALFHIQWRVPAVDLLLPVGISFYTFQALSYTMDVYRGDIYAEKDFFRYALFVSFFPQLVAGPIERSKNLLRQLAVPKPFDFAAAREGLLLMLWGYFLKIVIADRAALFVDTVYGSYTKYEGWYLIAATALFAVQIYCDFYGYSSIAMGAAGILGIKLTENFNAPYLSASVAEFWRNWHISLTSWFRDYLYIPLGGSRRGTLRKQCNRLLVFLVSGLWHGAKFTFVAWGLLNGLYQVLGDALKPLRDRLVKILGINPQSFGCRLMQTVTTFVLVDLSWVFFRARRFREVPGILLQMCKAGNLWVLLDGSLYRCGLDEKDFRLLLVCIGILLFADLCKKRGIALRRVIARQDYWFRCLFYAVAVCAVLLFGIWGPGYDAANFIYFQF